MKKIVSFILLLIVAVNAKAESIDIFFNTMALGSDYEFYFTDMPLTADLDVAITDNPSIADYQIFISDQNLMNSIDVNIMNTSIYGSKSIFISNQPLGCTNIRISDSPNTAKVTIYFASQPTSRTLNLHVNSSKRISLQQAIAILYVLGLRNVR